jgi:hypothetical protein
MSKAAAETKLYPLGGEASQPWIPQEGEQNDADNERQSVDPAQLVSLYVKWLEYQVALERHRHLKTQLAQAQERLERQAQQALQKEHDWTAGLTDAQHMAARPGWGIDFERGVWVPPQE